MYALHNVKVTNSSSLHDISVGWVDVSNSIARGKHCSSFHFFPCFYFEGGEGCLTVKGMASIVLLVSIEDGWLKGG